MTSRIDVSMVDGLESLSPKLVSTRAAMKALDTTKITTAYLTDGGRTGPFRWKTGDFSALVTLDNMEGLYIASNTDPSGSTGVWERVREGLRANFLWFGAVAGTNCTNALNGALRVRSVASLYIPGNDLTYQINAPQIFDGGSIDILGDGADRSRLEWVANVTAFSLGQTTPINKLKLINIGIFTNQPASSRTAVRAKFANTDIELDAVITGCAISGISYNTTWWGEAIDLTNPSHSWVKYNFIVGHAGTAPSSIPTDTNFGIRILSTQLAIIQYVEKNTVLYYETGIKVHITGSPGIEGVYVQNNNVVQCVDGIVVMSDFSGGYAGAQYNVFMNHCEFFNKGIIVQGLKDFDASKNMTLAAVTTTATVSIHVLNCRKGNVNDNTMGDGNAPNNTLLSGIWIDDSDYVNVCNNIADTQDYAVLFINGSTFCTERNNKQQNAIAKRFLDTSAGAGNNIVPETNIKTAAYIQNVTVTVQIPDDDTPPQNTEGTEILAVTITPKSSSSKIMLRFSGWGTLSGLGTMVAGVWRDGQANALNVCAVVIRNAEDYEQLVLDYVDSPGSTSPVTYRVRVGPTGALNMRMNGSSSGRRFGGRSSSTLIASEING